MEVYCSLLSAPMSPAQSMPTGICFLPRTMKMPAAFSGLSAFALNSGVAGVSTPEITLISDSLPTNGSAIVLNTWRGEALAHVRVADVHGFGLRVDAVIGVFHRAGHVHRQLIHQRTHADAVRLETGATGTMLPS